MQRVLKKGLTGFDLKYLALIFMVLDHIYYFFRFTGKVPIVFSWVGRLSAPLFLFCFIEGFKHTHDRRKYFLKIYLIAAFMGAIQFGFYNVLSPFVRGDGFFPENAMLSSFAILFVVMQGIEWIKEKRFLIGFAAAILPIIAPFLMNVFIYSPFIKTDNSTGLWITNLINFTILPMHSFIKDGGTATLIEGLVIYLFSNCKNQRIRIFAYAIVEILIGIVAVKLAGMPFNTDTLFFKLYDWISVFSIIFLLCYNGSRGKGNARFFYWFYPAHIYILYGISIAIYMVTK